MAPIRWHGISSKFQGRARPGAIQHNTTLHNIGGGTGKVEKRRFGGTDMEVTVLGFGGAEIGFEKASPETVEQVLGGALDAGLNVIDTAECYVDSEEKIGNAVGHRRKDYYLFTKCGHPQASGVADWSPASLIATIERSLVRLKTEYVDLVQLHSCSEEELRKGDVIQALQTARAKGYTRYIGYSGDSAAARYAVECAQFDTLQTSVNIADQEAIVLTLPLARERGMGVIAKRPIANAAWRNTSRPDNDYHLPYWERIQELKYDFLQGPLDESIPSAMRFTLSVPGVHTAIVGTKKPGRWSENARAVTAGPLSEQEFEQIRSRWREVAGRDWTGQI